MRTGSGFGFGGTGGIGGGGTSRVRSRVFGRDGVRRGGTAYGRIGAGAVGGRWGRAHGCFDDDIASSDGAHVARGVASAACGRGMVPSAEGTLGAKRGRSERRGKRGCVVTLRRKVGQCSCPRRPRLFQGSRDFPVARLHQTGGERDAAARRRRWWLFHRALRTIGDPGPKSSGSGRAGGRARRRRWWRCQPPQMEAKRETATAQVASRGGEISSANSRRRGRRSSEQPRRRSVGGPGWRAHHSNPAFDAPVRTPFVLAVVSGPARRTSTLYRRRFSRKQSRERERARAGRRAARRGGGGGRDGVVGNPGEITPVAPESTECDRSRRLQQPRLDFNHHPGEHRLYSERVAATS